MGADVTPLVSKANDHGRPRSPSSIAKADPRNRSGSPHSRVRPAETGTASVRQLDAVVEIEHRHPEKADAVVAAQDAVVVDVEPEVLSQ